MKKRRVFNSPIVFPVFFFIFLILAGALLLQFSEKSNPGALSWTDAAFTATSAACVTGLTVVDTGAYFSTFGQALLLCLMQIGGLGIMTFSSLSIYLLTRKTRIVDRIAVGQVLLHDTSFNLGKFLIEIVSWTLLIEAAGALLLYVLEPHAFSPFSAVFHSVSAFCNAGFSLFSNSLEGWRGGWAVNLVFILLIVVGGIGFSVFIEFKNVIKRGLRLAPWSAGSRLSWYATVVIRTSLFLVLFGWAAIYLAEFVGYHRLLTRSDALLSSLFQSVTCRTAGFNTLTIGEMTNVSLVILLFLMFVGGAPGSCAGGIKVTTFRVLAAAIWSQLKGKRQTEIGRSAVKEEDVRKALVLFVIAILIIFLAVFVLDFTEGGELPHPQIRGQYLEILFESVSAFSTVGLSTGLTPKLSVAGKWIIMALMFIGRLGPLFLISALQSVREPQRYNLPERNIMIG